MPVSVQGQSGANQSGVQGSEHQIFEALQVPRLTADELRELARILHEMLRRDLALERNRLGR